jgi:predicted permease
MTSQAFFDQRMTDLRRAARQLWQAPGFTAAAIVTLALGIGVNTAIFTLTEAVLLKSLPVRQPRELFSLGDAVLNGDTTALQDSFTLYSYPLYEYLRDGISGVSSIAAFQSWLATISVRREGLDQQPRPARAEYVSGNYFSTFGIGAAAGRLIADDDDRPDRPPAAVISYAAWARSGFDRRVVGGTIAINGVPVMVVGVAPAGFFGETLRAEPPDYWLPLALEPATTADNPLLHKDDVFWLYALARVPPATRLDRLQGEINEKVRRWVVDHRLVGDRDRPRVEALRVLLTPASGGIAGLQHTYGEGLKLLTVLSALVLLIACVNIANLLLARGSGRRSQMAIRVALGAARHRLIGETITEGLLLAMGGGAAGFLVGAVATRAIVALVFRGEDAAPFSAAPSLAVLGFTGALALLTGVLFSAVPAWRGSNPHPADALRGSGRGVRDTAVRPRRWLLAGQAAFSLVLLVGAGLLTATLRRLDAQPLGFVRDQVIIVGLNPAIDGYTVDRLPALYRRLDDRLPRIPGVSSASYALHAPLDEWNWGARVQFDGRPESTSSATADRASYSRVSPHYFETIGTRLRRGRAIDEHDTPASPRVAVVNEAFVVRFFPHEDPVGRRFGFTTVAHSRDFEIVGVVEDTKYRDVRQAAEPMFFLPLAQTVAYDDTRLAAYQRWSLFIDGLQLRMAGSVAAARPGIERALAEVDPNLTILRIRPLDEYADVQLNSPRLLARLTTLYGGLALALACVGLYGVTTYTVTHRTRELGVRMALGATRGNVILAVCRQALTPIVGGVGVGVPAAILGGKAIAGQLFGIEGGNPVIIAVAALTLAACASLAAIIPAYRAGAIDPLEALRAE